MFGFLSRKMVGWIGLLGGLAGVVADATGTVGAQAAHIAQIVGLVIAAAGGSIVRPSSAATRRSD